MEITLSKIFREQFDLSEDIPVFDRAMPVSEYDRQTHEVNPCWVHVVNQNEQVKKDIEENVGFIFPEGYNNKVDLAWGGRVVYFTFANRVPQQ